MCKLQLSYSYLVEFSICIVSVNCCQSSVPELVKMYHQWFCENHKLRLSENKVHNGLIGHLYTC